MFFFCLGIDSRELPRFVLQIAGPFKFGTSCTHHVDVALWIAAGIARAMPQVVPRPSLGTLKGGVVPRGDFVAMRATKRSSDSDEGDEDSSLHRFAFVDGSSIDPGRTLPDPEADHVHSHPSNTFTKWWRENLPFAKPRFRGC